MISFYCLKNLITFLIACLKPDMSGKPEGDPVKPIVYSDPAGAATSHRNNPLSLHPKMIAAFISCTAYGEPGSYKKQKSKL